MASDPEVLQPFPQVCADVVIARGQYYWEVDVCNSSMYRIGKNSLEFVFAGLMPALSLLPEETVIISQQDCACSSLQSHKDTHTHINMCTCHQTIALTPSGWNIGRTGRVG